MKRVLRLALLPSLLLMLIAIVWSCKSSGNKTMGTGGGGTPADITITINGISGSSSYSPDTANVVLGQTVAWKNNGGTTHTATSDDGHSFNTGDVGNGSTSSPITINTLGTLTYHCAIHGFAMTGALHVTAVP